MLKHNLSFSSGNDRGSVYVSAGYLTNDGMLKGNSDTFSRLNGQVKLDYKIKPWLKVMGNANLSKGKMRGVIAEILNDAFLMDPLTPVAYRSADLPSRSEEHTSELQSRQYLVCRLLLEKKKHDHH